MCEAQGPLVSVIVATRNRKELLMRALESIAAQSFENFEVIVVDDGSSAEILEHHEELMRSLGKRFRLQLPIAPDSVGTGPARARNRGLEQAIGTFITFLDDDDHWTDPEFLQAAVRLLEDRKADYLFGHLLGFRGESKLNPGWVPSINDFQPATKFSTEPEAYWVKRIGLMRLAKRFMVHPSNCIVRASLLREAGGFFCGLWTHAEDVNLMFRLFDRLDGAIYYPKCVTMYRMPEGNSVSLTVDRLVHKQQDVLAMQNIRLVAITRDTCKIARARESWAYREIAKSLRTAGRDSDAKDFSLQALVTYPSLGTVLEVLQNCWRSFIVRH